MRLRPWWGGYGAGTLLLLVCFFASALMFCTSMLSTSTVMTNTGEERCQGVRPVDQVVLVLVDAMRPDFVLSALRRYSRNHGGCTLHRVFRRENGVADGGAEVPDYYSGPTLRYIQAAINDTGDASHGFFFVADPPTTTAQRIKAISTGTMPAFLEAGANFNSDATPIDSLLRQTRGRAVLLGDDTWTKLFPGKQHWKKTVAIPSFDVADFHTNDDAVLHEVFNVLTTETAETDEGTAAGGAEESYAKLIVAHFLGIDHVGHRINAANRDMDKKIVQLNAMLHNVSRTLRQRKTRMNTMLLVLGDHGMTQNGDHGGDSALETDTFLFAQYFHGSAHVPPSHREGGDLSAMTTMTAKKAALKRHMAALRQEEQADPELVRLDSCCAVAGVAPSELGAAYQVDVTPTVSVLLGNPIPYSSFGRVLPEVLALADGEADLEEADRCNERQMLRYFAESGMEVPANPPWERTRGNTTRQRIAAMSFYARRTRTDMNMAGMVVGGLALIACALSAFALREVQALFRVPTVSIFVGFCVLIIRWSMTLANSFIVHEDVGVFGLFTFYLLVTFSATRVGERSRLVAQKNAGGGAPAREKRRDRSGGLVHFIVSDRRACAVLVVVAVARGLLPYVLKHRFHITHAVESESILDGVVRRWVWGGLGALMKRAGLVVGAVLWASTAPAAGRQCRRFLWAAAGVTTGAMCLSHNVPILHHIVPVVGVVVHTCLVQRGWSPLMQAASARGSARREYAYFVWVLWTASICNEQVVASVVIAAYGVLLPVLVRLLQADGASPAVQAVLLHLLSFVAFFMEGHQCLLSTIDWNASFVGLPGYSMPLGGILVLSRTFNAFFFLPVACKMAWGACALPSTARADTAVKEKGKSSGAVNGAHKNAAADSFSFLRYLLLELMVVEAGMSAFSAFIQKNHLMLLPVFCPKLLFDVVITLMTGAGILLSYL